MSVTNRVVVCILNALTPTNGAATCFLCCVIVLVGQALLGRLHLLPHNMISRSLLCKEFPLKQVVLAWP